METHEPAPARALDTKGSHVEFLRENIQRTPILVDGILERAILEYAAVSLLLGRGGRKVFPEEGVVDVAYKDKISKKKRVWGDRPARVRTMSLFTYHHH